MNKLSKLIILVFLISLFGCLGIFIYAGSGDNTSGFAWSENIGWVSFNNTTGGGSNYGVHVDPSSGNISGYAWSEHVGWAIVSGQATASGSGYNVTGKLDFLAIDGGWDGEVRFQDVTIDSNGDWHGWAWSDMIVGWLSFNSADPGAGGGSAYKVTSVLNQPPTATDLNVVKGDYCSSPPAHYFSWAYTDPDGDDESQFKFQVDNNSNFSSPEVSRLQRGLSNPSPTTNNQTVIVATSPGSDQIGYNTTYYWRVRVWDSKGADSGWQEGSSFKTELHRYPSISFNLAPQEPSAEEDVLFADQSTVYGGATKSTWSWTFEDGNPASSGAQNPTIQFTTTGDCLVTLGVRDSDSFYCQTSRTVGVQIKLPGWKEILPW